LSDLCKWLHESLELLELLKFPFELERLPENGIYFFYEIGETWGHGETRPRIVRVGTHKDGNFRKRISEHYVLDELKMNFDSNRPAPHDRSIFRKNIGRALLNQSKDKYSQVWDIDFTSHEKRVKFGHFRDIRKEKKIEQDISKILRLNFSFRFIELTGQAKRMGSTGLESSLIGTLSHCNLCKPSVNWLGNHSPKKEIRESGLWQIQHLKADPMDERDKVTILNAIKNSRPSTC
jgi:hypothetical protein